MCTFHERRCSHDFGHNIAWKDGYLQPCIGWWLPRDAVKSLVTEDVYNDKLLFKVDKYHKITQLTLQGTYVKSDVIPTKLVDNKLTATVYATQTLNFKDKQGKDAVKAFDITYDGHRGKLTSVKEDGTIDVNVDSSVF